MFATLEALGLELQTSDSLKPYYSILFSFPGPLSERFDAARSFCI